MVQRQFPLPSTGERFGRWVVIDNSYRKGQTWFVPCRCDCGTIRGVAFHSLKNGISKSCGCNQDYRTQRIIHGEVGSPLYVRWKAMRQRCNDSHQPGYKNYGGRGITVCREWQEYIPFRDWAMSHGYRDDLELNRIDNSRGYEPSNCDWVTREQNQRNTRQNVWLTVFNETKTMAEWAEDPRCVVNYEQLKYRIWSGWSAERALTEPLHSGNRFTTEQ